MNPGILVIPPKRGYAWGEVSRGPTSPLSRTLPSEESLGKGRDEANLDEQADDRLARS